MLTSQYSNIALILAKQLNACSDIESVLLRYKDLLEKDMTLYTLYLHLSYQPELGTFRTPPDKQQTLDQIKKFYHFELPLSPASGTDKFIAEENSLTTVCTEDLFDQRKYMALGTESDQIRVEKPGIERSQRGLRALSLRVRDLVYEKQITTYKEVSEELIADIYASEGLDETTEDKNIKRRVYDALNVLLSSGVIAKVGKEVTWAGYPGCTPPKKPQNAPEQKSQIKGNIAEKKRILSGQIDKISCLTGIIERNKIMQVNEERVIRFPFVLVATDESLDNSMSVNIDPDENSMRMKFARDVKLVGDIDLLSHLRFKRRRDGLPRELVKLMESPIL